MNTYEAAVMVMEIFLLVDLFIARYVVGVLARDLKLPVDKQTNRSFVFGALLLIFGLLLSIILGLA